MKASCVGRRGHSWFVLWKHNYKIDVTNLQNVIVIITLVLIIIKKWKEEIISFWRKESVTGPYHISIPHIFEMPLMHKFTMKYERSSVSEQKNSYTILPLSKKVRIFIYVHTHITISNYPKLDLHAPTAAPCSNLFFIKWIIFIIPQKSDLDGIILKVEQHSRLKRLRLCCNSVTDQDMKQRKGV